jgi:ribulose-5-phosphate 4-epimerase/fuculose-1-phosphate aldolase
MSDQIIGAFTPRNAPHQDIGGHAARGAVPLSAPSSPGRSGPSARQRASTTADPVTKGSPIAGPSRHPELVFDLPPTFATVDEERQHRKQRLAVALRVFGRFGFGEGVAGHITARDPELTDHFWVNPFGLSFRRVKVHDLILVDHEGTVVHGNRPVSAAAFAIHSQIHAARPDVVAAAHAHSVHGKAFSTLGRLLSPLTQDAAVFYEDHALLDDYGGVVVDPAYGRRIADTLGPHKALIHRNHGLITVGTSVDEAAWWFVTMDRSCQAQLLAEAAGSPHPIGDDAARLTRDQIGHSLAGWVQFQPLVQDVLAEEPDVLDG